MDVLEELQYLREWKRQQTIVMDQLNLPAIGKELEVPLGETIPDKVLPAIKKLKNENRSLSSRS